MADIFLSYARESAETATRIATILRDQGYSVWFDEELPAHRAYADVIASQLDAARAVLVLWSEQAARSQWVRSEANRAREKGNLVQLRLDGVHLPMPFDQIQCAQLAKAELSGIGWRSVTNAIYALVHGELDAEPATASRPQAHRIPSLAVLAFRELGPQSDDYLGEGIAEEIVSALARLPNLRVASGTASEHGLQIDACLEGSVRRSDERARISVRLLDTKTGFARWSETFDRTMSDVFAVQDEIAQSVAAALGVVLLDRDAQSIGACASSDAQANDLALKARHLARQELEAERRTAAELFREAIGRDPEFALAYAGLADVLVSMARWHLPDWKESEREAVEAARKSVALAPDLADAQLALGAALALVHDPEAHKAYSRALALSPHDAGVHYRAARYFVLSGDKAGAVRHYERAFELAPDDYRYIVYALQEYQALGDEAGERSCLQRSAAAIERHLKLYPSDVRALGHGAGVMACLGHQDRMQQMIDRALALRPEDYGNVVTLACAAMLGSDAEQALDLLERAAATGQGDREWLMQDNDLKPLHGNPRFEAIIEQMSG
ncbi:MAG: TIR domain-containing protein [Pseudomonadota bacterium]|nr:TIR domain-containing protein [Pseudomonadota bacterium]